MCSSTSDEPWWSSLKALIPLFSFFQTGSFTIVDVERYRGGGIFYWWNTYLLIFIAHLPFPLRSPLPLFLFCSELAFRAKDVISHECTRFPPGHVKWNCLLLLVRTASTITVPVEQYWIQCGVMNKNEVFVFKEENHFVLIWGLTGGSCFFLILSYKDKNISVYRPIFEIST